MTSMHQQDGTMKQAEGPMSSSSSIPKISQETRLTSQDVLNLLEINKFPEGWMTPEEIVSETQIMINKRKDGVKWFWENRKLHLAQLEQLQTF